MDDDRRTDSGIEIRPVYGAEDLAGSDPEAQLGRPGQAPYTRGVYGQMYRSR
ncbi:MAG: methylmalonyl-CoA mutase family protein, partial [Acidimicrobiia bacterium]